MSAKVRAALALVIACLSLVLLPQIASAAPAARSVAASAPVAVPSLEVQIWAGGEPGQSVVIVSGLIPEDVQLPVTVRIPMPSGAQVVWAGEILGGDATGDPARAYEVVDGQGGKVVKFEVSQSRQVQVEFNGFPLTVTGTDARGTVDWVQSAEASETGFSVRFPANAADVKTTPTASGTPQRNATGETLYTLPSKVLKPGGRLGIQFSYATKAAAAKTRSGSANTVLIVLGGALAVALAVLVFMLTRRRTAA